MTTMKPCISVLLFLEFSVAIPYIMMMWYLKTPYMLRYLCIGSLQCCEVVCRQVQPYQVYVDTIAVKHMQIQHTVYSMI